MDKPGQTSRSLTWALLLGKWTEFARSAVALPETGEGGRYRKAVPSLITLHAVTHALGELDMLENDEQAPAIDRAEILIRRETGLLGRIWDGDPLPEAIEVFVLDAVSALDHARDGSANSTNSGGSGCLEWMVTTDGVVFEHPAALLGAVAEAGIPIDLYVPSPGIPFFAGAVAACVRLEQDGVSDSVLEDLAAVVGEFLGPEVEGPFSAVDLRQVYRQFDFARGGPVRDLIAPMSASDTPGQPLLVPGLKAGEIRPVPLPPRSAAGGKLGVLPVVDAGEIGEIGEVGRALLDGPHPDEPRP